MLSGPLVVVVVVVVVVEVVVVVVVVVVVLVLLVLLVLVLTPAAFFLSLVAADFLKRSGKTSLRPIFCASEAQNHGVYDVFCFW